MCRQLRIFQFYMTTRVCCYFQHVWLGPRDSGFGAAWIHPDGLIRTKRSVRKTSGRDPYVTEDAHSEGL